MSSACPFLSCVAVTECTRQPSRPGHVHAPPIILTSIRQSADLFSSPAEDQRASASKRARARAGTRADAAAKGAHMLTFHAAGCLHHPQVLVPAELHAGVELHGLPRGYCSTVLLLSTRTSASREQVQGRLWAGRPQHAEQGTSVCSPWAISKGGIVGGPCKMRLRPGGCLCRMLLLLPLRHT